MKVQKGLYDGMSLVELHRKHFGEPYAVNSRTYGSGTDF